MAAEVEHKRDSMDAGLPEIQSKLAGATLQTSTPAKRRVGLTDLPASVRNRIFAHVLDTELVNLGKENVSYTHSIKDGHLHFSASRPPFPVETALFYVNKEIGGMARTFFYKKNLFVRFEIYTGDARHAKTMLEDSGVLFATPYPSLLENCTQHAMDLTIVEKNSSQKRAAVMFPAQYLPRLINFMEQASRASKAWAPAHALFITVRNTYGLNLARLQGDLLELFRILNNMGAVTVNKENLLPGYADGLQSSMVAASFDPVTWLKTVRNMVDSSIDAFRKKAFDDAAQLCQSAIIAITYAYLTRAEALHMRPDSFHKSIQRLRYDAERTLGSALRLKHEQLTMSSPSWFKPVTGSSPPSPELQTAAIDLLAAETAASQALSLATDSPSPTSNPWFHSLPPELIPLNKAEWFSDSERAQAWYEAGLVHLELGECLFAAGDLERAERLLVGANEPNEEVQGQVKTAFERAREGIDWSIKPGAGLKSLAALAARAAE